MNLKRIVHAALIIARRMRTKTVQRESTKTYRSSPSVIVQVRPDEIGRNKSTKKGSRGPRNVRDTEFDDEQCIHDKNKPDGIHNPKPEDDKRRIRKRV